MKFKKFIAMLITISMVLGSFSTAFAAETNEDDTVKSEGFSVVD